MTMATKQAILKEKLRDYLKANKAGKGRLLDQLGGITGMNRKAVIRRFKGLQLADSARIESRGRKIVYGSMTSAALKEVWLLFEKLCAERLHPHLPEYIALLKRDKIWQYDQATTELLLRMSLGTMKNRLTFLATGEKARPKQGSTKPSAIKEIVPIRRGAWENPDPGFGEVDTVAHCGSSLIGDYAYSLQYTDVATIWTCLAAQWNKGETATLKSMVRIKNKLPFSLKGVDSDSGGEFINWKLNSWCQSQGIVFTRTRPYYKNDHGRIEQKNYVNIRKFLGYVRLGEISKVKLMNELYDCLEDYINFFLPSMKCLRKERLGSHYKRIYDHPQTAYQRVLNHPDINPKVKEQLQAKYAILRPKDLKERIERLSGKILQNAHY